MEEFTEIELAKFREVANAGRTNSGAETVVKENVVTNQEDAIVPTTNKKAPLIATESKSEFSSSELLELQVIAKKGSETERVKQAELDKGFKDYDHEFIGNIFNEETSIEDIKEKLLHKINISKDKSGADRFHLEETNNLLSDHSLTKMQSIYNDATDKDKAVRDIIAYLPTTLSDDQVLLKDLTKAQITPNILINRDEEVVKQHLQTIYPGIQIQRTGLGDAIIVRLPGVPALGLEAQIVEVDLQPREFDMFGVSTGNREKEVANLDIIKSHWDKIKGSEKGHDIMRNLVYSDAFNDDSTTWERGDPDDNIKTFNNGYSGVGFSMASTSDDGKVIKQVTLTRPDGSTELLEVDGKLTGKLEEILFAELTIDQKVILDKEKREGYNEIAKELSEEKVKRGDVVLNTPLTLDEKKKSWGGYNRETQNLNKSKIVREVTRLGMSEEGLKLLAKMGEHLNDDFQIYNLEGAFNKIDSGKGIWGALDVQLNKLPQEDIDMLRFAHKKVSDVLVSDFKDNKILQAHSNLTAFTMGSLDTDPKTKGGLVLNKIDALENTKKINDYQTKGVEILTGLKDELQGNINNLADLGGGVVKNVTVEYMDATDKNGNEVSKMFIKFDEVGNLNEEGESKRALFLEQVKTVSSNYNNFQQEINDTTGELDKARVAHSLSYGDLDNHLNEVYKIHDLGTLLYNDIKSGFHDMALTIPTLINGDKAANLASLQEETTQSLEQNFAYDDEDAGFWRYAIRTGGQQSANLALAFATGGGSALATKGMSVARQSLISKLAIGGAFGSTSGTNKFRTLLQQQDSADEAAYKIDYLLENKDMITSQIGEEDYNEALSKARELYQFGNTTFRQKQASAFATALVEGTITAFIGTAQNANSIVKTLQAPMKNISKLVEMNSLSRFSSYATNVLLPVAGEVVEEVSIMGLTQIADGLILNREISFEEWDDTAMAAIIIAGPMNAPPVAYAALMSEQYVRADQRRDGFNLAEIKATRLTIQTLNKKQDDIRKTSDYINLNKEEKAKHDEDMAKEMAEAKQAHGRSHASLELHTRGLEVDAMAGGKIDYVKSKRLELELQNKYDEAGVNSKHNTPAKIRNQVKKFLSDKSPKIQKEFNESLSVIKAKITTHRSAPINYNNMHDALGQEGTDLFAELDRKNNDGWSRISKRDKWTRVVEEMRERSVKEYIDIIKNSPKYQQKVFALIRGVDEDGIKPYSKNKKEKKNQQEQENFLFEQYGRGWGNKILDSYSINTTANTTVAEVIKKMNAKHGAGIVTVDMKDVAGDNYTEKLNNYIESLPEAERGQFNPRVKAEIVKSLNNKNSNGSIIGGTFITTDGDKIRGRIREGIIDAGTTLIHELNHAQDDISFLTQKDLNTYSENLAEAMANNKKFKAIHDQAMARVIESYEENKDFVGPFENRSDQFKDEYTKVIGEMLYSEEKSLSVEKADSYMATWLAKSAFGYSINTPKRALNYVLGKNHATRRMELSAVSEAMISKVKKAGGSLIQKENKGSIKNSSTPPFQDGNSAFNRATELLGYPEIAIDSNGDAKFTDAQWNAVADRDKLVIGVMVGDAYTSFAEYRLEKYSSLPMFEDFKDVIIKNFTTGLDTSMNGIPYLVKTFKPGKGRKLSSHIYDLLNVRLLHNITNERKNGFALETKSGKDASGQLVELDSNSFGDVAYGNSRVDIDTINESEIRDLTLSEEQDLEARLAAEARQDSSDMTVTPMMFDSLTVRNDAGVSVHIDLLARIKIKQAIADAYAASDIQFEVGSKQHRNALAKELSSKIAPIVKAIAERGVNWNNDTKLNRADVAANLDAFWADNINDIVKIIPASKVMLKFPFMMEPLLDAEGKQLTWDKKSTDKYNDNIDKGLTRGEKIARSTSQPRYIKKKNRAESARLFRSYLNSNDINSTPKDNSSRRNKRKNSAIDVIAEEMAFDMIGETLRENGFEIESAVQNIEIQYQRGAIKHSMSTLSGPQIVEFEEANHIFFQRLIEGNEAILKRGYSIGNVRKIWNGVYGENNPNFSEDTVKGIVGQFAANLTPFYIANIKVSRGDLNEISKALDENLNLLQLVNYHERAKGEKETTMVGFFRLDQRTKGRMDKVRAHAVGHAEITLLEMIKKANPDFTEDQVREEQLQQMQVFGQKAHATTGSVGAGLMMERDSKGNQTGKYVQKYKTNKNGDFRIDPITKKKIPKTRATEKSIFDSAPYDFQENYMQKIDRGYRVMTPQERKDYEGDVKLPSKATTKVYWRTSLVTKELIPMVIKYSAPTEVTVDMISETGPADIELTENSDGTFSESARDKIADANMNFAVSQFEYLKTIEDVDQHIIYLAAIVQGGSATPLRAGAKLKYRSSKMPGMEHIGNKKAMAKWLEEESKKHGRTYKKIEDYYRYEHSLPKRVLANLLYKSIVMEDTSFSRDALLKDYVVAIIPVEQMDKVLGDAGLGTITVANYIPGVTNVFERYFNAFTLGKIQFSLVSYDGKEKYGEAHEDFYNTPNRQALSKPEYDKKEMYNTAKSIAVKNSISPKGISVWDFDDTLAQTKSNVLYTLPDGSKGKINATQFALESKALEDEGAIFDFSEFEKITEGKKGPLFDKAIARNKKFGNDNVYILTARPQVADKAIHTFLKNIGLDIKIENIVGLADGNPRAKADWVVEKYVEGYNDFYFADDAYKNIKAVQDALSVLDVKSKVQLAKVKDSISMNSQINQMIEGTSGIAARKVFSKVKGEIAGVAMRRGMSYWEKFKIVPPSAQDFLGLLYPIIRWGKQGESDMQFIKDKLIDPYARAMQAVTSARVKLRKRFKENTKRFKISEKVLQEKVPGTEFTQEMAIRVYTWNKAGHKIPGLSAKDLKVLINHVKNTKNLIGFAESLPMMSEIFPPTESWSQSTLQQDIQVWIEKDVRSKALAQWQANVDVIFSEKNMNKIEAAYGAKQRKFIQESLDSMRTGRRPMGAKSNGIASKIAHYLQGSIGVIMFMNTRSAAFQLLSATNFVNWSENNPYRAIVNWKWADVKMIWKSDFLTDRRAGLRLNVLEADIASEASGLSMEATGWFDKLMQSMNFQKGDKGGGYFSRSAILANGFIMTKLADSLAISIGGASYFRNRMNLHIKNGMSPARARKQAFIDFREQAEKSQQSSRQDMISSQQGSIEGKLILAFANTPSQYARIVEKAAQDLKNRRGDTKSNMSKIGYYLFLQNFAFNYLQQALFADDEDESVLDSNLSEKELSTLNGMLDSYIRGLGVGGALASMVKNFAMKLYEIKMKKEDGTFGARYSDAVYTLFSIAPPISDKLGRVKRALSNIDFNGDEMEEQGLGLSLDNPVWESVALGLSIANLPTDRLYRKLLHITQATEAELDNWTRLQLLFGYSKWQLTGEREQENNKAIEKQKKKDDKVLKAALIEANKTPLEKIHDALLKEAKQKETNRKSRETRARNKKIKKDALLQHYLDNLNK